MQERRIREEERRKREAEDRRAREVVQEEEEPEMEEGEDWFVLLQAPSKIPGKLSSTYLPFVSITLGSTSNPSLVSLLRM